MLGMVRLGQALMSTTDLLAVLMLASSPVLAAIALAVRHAGQDKILNVVDYTRVADRALLHRRVGNRLLFLPLASVAGGLISMHSPIGAFFGVCLLAVVGSAVFISTLVTQQS